MRPVGEHFRIVKPPRLPYPWRANGGARRCVFIMSDSHLPEGGRASAESRFLDFSVSEICEPFGGRKPTI